MNVVLEKTRQDELIDMCRKRLPSIDEEKIRKAYDFAAIAHQNDKRASGEPYFTHPYAVAKILAEEIPFDDTSVVCGLLHDVVEDNEEYNLDHVRERFGDDVAVIVDGLTKIKELFKGVAVSQAENYRKLLMSITKDVRVIIVKFADRLHNMRELEFLKPEKRKRIAKETFDIYSPLANRFGLGKIKWELEDLAFKELNRRAYNEIRKKISAKRPERETFIKNFIAPIKKRLDPYGFNYEIAGRPKHLYSIYRKMIKQNKPFEEIYDLFAVRVVIDTDDMNDCYTAFGVINGEYIPVPDRFKDYIAIPKANNYQSIHTTVVGPGGTLVEVQIRTRKMHEIAEQGVAAHWRYKEGENDVDRTIDQYVQWIREILDNSGNEYLRKSIIENFKLDLYSDEIYVFTPKGDLKRLPVHSTPVDFAFAIHSKVGQTCIGAKVNKKIVPLDSRLRKGDQVEIITSKNQTPNKNWLKFVQTRKAKVEIKKWLNQEEERVVERGKNVWEKRLKKEKRRFSEDEFRKFYRKLKFNNVREFYAAVADGGLDLDEILARKEEEKPEEIETSRHVEKFQEVARDSGGDLVVDGDAVDLQYYYAKCCNPVPGDEVAGFVTAGAGVAVHRKTCRNLIEIAKREPEKIVSVAWAQAERAAFVAGLAISGEDNTGMLNEIANTIVDYKNTNIKSINIESSDSLFEGVVAVYVRDLEHLSHLIERLKKIKGVRAVARMSG